jgi:hypothetical protein
MYETVPDVKLIVLLRDPVDRAYSHYQMQVRRGREDLSFEQAIAEESGRLDGEMDRMLADRDYYSVAYRWYGYLSKGMYASQLRNWLDRFPREQFLVVRSESLSAQTSRTMQRVFQFLGLPHREHDAYKRARVGRYGKMRVAVREHLQRFYSPHNRELAGLLGTEMNWG